MEQYLRGGYLLGLTRMLTKLGPGLSYIATLNISSTLVFDDLHQVKVLAHVRLLLDLLKNTLLNLLLTSCWFALTVNFEIFAIIVLCQPIGFLVVVRLQVIQLISDDALTLILIHLLEVRAETFYAIGKASLPFKPHVKSM